MFDNHSFLFRNSGSRCFSNETKSNKLCLGCGSHIQTNNPDSIGYIPPTVEEGFSGGWKQRWAGLRGQVVVNVPSGVDSASTSQMSFRSTRLYCQRCYRLQQYGRIEHPHQPDGNIRFAASLISVDDIIASIPQRSVVIHIVDVLNLEISSLPEIYEKLHRRNIPIISVVNKIDCLPRCEEASVGSISRWTRQLVKVLRRNAGPDGRPNLVALSSATGEGFADLERLLSKFISAGCPRDIMVVGSVNSGKSTFCNRFLSHIGFKHLGYINFQRGIGGITRSPIPGTTQKSISFPISDGIVITDTPGISIPRSMMSYMRTSNDFRSLICGKTMQPPIFTLRQTNTLLIGAMARVSVQAGVSAQIAAFVSPNVTLHICRRSSSDEFLRRKAGTFLYPPFVDNQSGTSPTLSEEWVTHRVRVFCGPSRSYDDVVIAGLGWISVYGHGHKILEVSVPKDVNVFRRPSMISKLIRLHGASSANFRSRARSLRMGKYKRKLKRRMNMNESKQTWRDDTRATEKSHLHIDSEPATSQLICKQTQHSYVVS